MSDKPSAAPNRNPKHEWLYNKPALKVRTHLRYNPSKYVIQSTDNSSKRTTLPWWMKYYQKDPRRFVIVSSVGCMGLFFGGFIWELVIKPGGQLLYHIKEAAFPPPMPQIDDDHP